MPSIAVVILTLNEELHIARAIQSVAGFAQEIFVIDSYSTDRTVEIAKAHGAVVLQHTFANQAKQLRWAMEAAPITADWVMKLDADEVVEADLAAEIAGKLPSLGSDVTGVRLKLKRIFWGRWIKHGGIYPIFILRIWRRGKEHIEDRWMDEHVAVQDGRVVSFEGHFADHNLNGLTYFTAKHNGYATREAVEVLNHRYGLFARSTDAQTIGTGSKQAAMKRLIKERIYNGLPLWFGPFSYFLYRYVFRLGFLDGRGGLIFCVLQGFWYRFLVAAKVCELEEALAGIRDPAEMRAELSRLTGLKLAP